MSSINLDPRLQDNHLPQSSIHSTHDTLHAIVSRPLGPPLPQAHPQQYDSPLQNIYLPHTPGSTGSANHDGGDGTHDGGPNDPKRPRACEACRGLKVRCEPDPNNLDGPCKRCAKANRNCVVTVPSRKRQKKTDSRVAELEKKIDALTASLHAQKSGSAPGGQGSENGLDQDSSNAQRHNPYQQVTNGGYGAPYVGRPEVRGDEWAQYPKASDADKKKQSAPPMVVAGQKRKQMESRSSVEYYVPTGAASGASTEPSGFLVQGNPQKQAQTHEYADVVDRGLLTADLASRMFDCYVEKMAPHMPAVVFPPGTTAAEVRKTKPTLFLAILSAASGSNHPELQRVLTKEVMAIYAERIIVNGEKTLELIQALHVSTLWYWPPEHFEELKFYQLIHIAAVMAIDIGMGKKNKSSKVRTAGLWRDHPWRRTPYPDSESIEARRAWLACYFLCCNASMGLRRPNLIRWTSFMADCVEVLQHSPAALPSDKTLCEWVKSQQIAEEVGTQFSMDDPGATITIADPKVQYALKGFERELDKWSSQIQPESASPTLKMTEHLVNLYMHEIAMHVDHNVEEFKTPFNEDAFRGNGDCHDIALTPAHIDALSVCLTSIDGIFETFLKFDVDTVRCLPVANFVRVAYAVVVLIKMYFAAATPNSELGKVINKDNMRVEQYLDGLVDIFKASAADEKSRPSAKFLMVLLMLKTWFHRQREGKLPSTTMPLGESTPAPAAVMTSEAPETVNNPSQKSMQQRSGPQGGYSPANTPLQLLSEVATGNSGRQSRSDSTNNYQGSSNDWSYQNYSNNNRSPMGQGYGSIPPNIDPSLVMDFNYNMGDNFEQAIGMTLGAGDFGSYIGDDAFFGGLLLDSVGGSALNFEGTF